MPSDHPSIYPRVMHHPPTHNQEAAPRLQYPGEHHSMVHGHGINQPRLHTEYNGSSMIGGYGHLNNPQVSYAPPPLPPPLNDYGYYHQGRMRNDATSSSHEPSHTRNAFHPNMHHQAPSSYPYQTTEHAFHPPDNGTSGGNKDPPSLPPSLPPALPPPALEASHDDEPAVTKNSIGSRDEDGHPNLLWLPEDQQHLTDLHCFVRKHCVFIFGATEDDVDSK